MSDVARSYPTASHVFVSAPTAAAKGFDLMLLDPAVAATLTPSGPIEHEEMNGYRPMRRVKADLRLPGRRARTLPVTLELLPWSESRSELTIWCKDRPGLLLERGVAAYLESAHRAMKALAELLVAEPVLTTSPRHALPAARDRRKGVTVQD